MYKVLFFKIVCIVERDILPCRSLLRVSRVDVWRLLIGTNVSVFFSSCVCSGEREGSTPCCQTTLAPMDRGQSFDDTWEILQGEECSQGVFGVLLIVLRYCRLHCTRVEKIQGILADQIPRPRNVWQSFGQESGPTYSAFPPLTKQLMSTAGLDKLAPMYPVYIWTCCLLHRHQQLRRLSPDACSPRLYHIYCDFHVVGVWV